MKRIDFGSMVGAELFDEETPYSDGEPKWAARSNWFVRFWGYVFSGTLPRDIPVPYTGQVILFYDPLTRKFRYRNENGFHTVGAAVNALDGVYDEELKAFVIIT